MTETHEFDQGIQAAFDPQPDPSAAAVGEAVTNLNSWWHQRWCQSCGHTFRRGDRVMISAERRVHHLNPALGCGSPAGASPGADADVREFAAGLAASWPVSGNLPVHSTDDVPSLLAPPVGGLRRAACLFCAHTFRPGEQVVVCPCSPFAPRCRYAVHRDPAQGLVCWESWRPSGGLKVCPILLHKLDD